MERIDFMRDPVMVFHFNGFIFEFIRDEVHVTDTANWTRYRIALEHYAAIPFLIQVLEK